MQAHEGTQPQEGATSLQGHAVARAIVSRAASVSFSQEVSTDSDYGWLAETLWKRVQALKRYPTKAAADRIEGDVLLAAVVRADGAIAEVHVTESSGHPLLDQAAVDAVRSASPLALLRPLDHAQVSVEIPIAYHVHN
jgi:protein TonB